MTTARKNIVELSVTRSSRCLIRCVLGGYLMGDGYGERKQWIEDRLEFLNASFAGSVGGIASMDTRLGYVRMLLIQLGSVLLFDPGW